MDWCRGSHRVGQLVLTLRRRDKRQAVGGSEAGGGGRSASLELPWEAMSWAGSDSASPLLHSISALSLESDHRPPLMSVWSRFPRGDRRLWASQKILFTIQFSPLIHNFTFCGFSCPQPTVTWDCLMENSRHNYLLSFKLLCFQLVWWNCWHLVPSGCSPARDTNYFFAKRVLTAYATVPRGA